MREELIEVSITHLGCNEQPGEQGAVVLQRGHLLLCSRLLSDWRSATEMEVVSLDWVSDRLCLVDKSLVDTGVLLFLSQLLDLAYSIDHC